MQISIEKETKYLLCMEGERFDLSFTEALDLYNKLSITLDLKGATVTEYKPCFDGTARMDMTEIKHTSKQYEAYGKSTKPEEPLPLYLDDYKEILIPWLTSKGILGDFLSNVREFEKEQGTSYYDAYGCMGIEGVINGFIWSDSSQGEDYWIDISIKWCEHLDGINQ